MMCRLVRRGDATMRRVLTERLKNLGGDARMGRCPSWNGGREVKNSPDLGDAEEPWSIRSQSGEVAFGVPNASQPSLTLGITDP